MTSQPRQIDAIGSRASSSHIPPGTYDRDFAVRVCAEVLDQPGTVQLLGAGHRRSQLGLEDDTRRGSDISGREWMILS